MFIWHLFFISKIGLWWFDHIKFMPFFNLALFALIVLGNHLINAAKFRLIVLGIITPLLAFALAIYELEEITRLALFLYVDNLLSFSFTYIFELISRIFPPEVLWSFFFVILTTHLLGRYIRLTTWVGLLLITTSVLVGTNSSTPIVQTTNQFKSVQDDENIYDILDSKLEAEKVALRNPQFQELKKLIGARLKQATPNELTANEQLERFYNQQQAIKPKNLSRKSGFNESSVTPDPNFDLIFIQVTGLSWAELKRFKQSSHPVFSQSDVLLTNFNTVSSQTKTSTSRLVFSNCGQMSSTDLKQVNPTNECNLFKQLKQVGFQIQYGFNHKGDYQQFEEHLTNLLGTKAIQPIKQNELPASFVGSNNSVLTRDIDFLTTWWENRIKLQSQPVAFFYNTLTLHDGNQLLQTNKDTPDKNRYQEKLDLFLTDLHDFIYLIRNSDQQVLLFIVPTHGAGLTAEFNQPNGIHEIPTPAITQVPVAAHWISPKYKQESIYDFPIKIQEPSSYLAISEFIDKWLHLPSNTRNQPTWPVLLADTPTTEFVSDEHNITVIQSNQSFLYKTEKQVWKTLAN